VPSALSRRFADYTLMWIGAELAMQSHAGAANKTGHTVL